MQLFTNYGDTRDPCECVKRLFEGRAVYAEWHPSPEDKIYSGVVAVAVKDVDRVKAVVVHVALHEEGFAWAGYVEDDGPFFNEASAELVAHLTPATTSMARKWRRGLKRA